MHHSGVRLLAYHRLDALEQLRLAASSPSPLAELVSDPILWRSLMRKTSFSTSRTHGRRSDGKRRSKDSDSSSTVFSVVLAEEERQVQYLKAMLRSASDKLQGEIRRANEAEERVAVMHKREQEILVKAIQSEQARQRAAHEVSRQQEEIKRYQMQVEMMQAQLHKADEDAKSLEQQRDEAEKSASRARETARQYKQTLGEWKAREEGREEGRRAGMVRGYSDGHLDGVRDGRHRGFEHGRHAGVREGRVVGEQDGRAFERQRALQEFDRFAKASGLDLRDRYVNVS